MLRRRYIYATDIVTIIRELGECLRWSWIKFSICGASEIKGHVYPWLGGRGGEGSWCVCSYYTFCFSNVPSSSKRAVQTVIIARVGRIHRWLCHVPPCRTCNLQRASQCHQFRAIDVVISLWRITLLAKFPAPVKLVTQRTCKVWMLENRRKRDRRAQGGGTSGKSRVSGESRRMNEREKRRSSRPTSNHNLALCRVVCRVGRSG